MSFHLSKCQQIICVLNQKYRKNKYKTCVEGKKEKESYVWNGRKLRYTLYQPKTASEGEISIY